MILPTVGADSTAESTDKLNKVENGQWEEDVSSFKTKFCLFRKASEFFATDILIRFLQNWFV